MTKLSSISARIDYIIALGIKAKSNPQSNGYLKSGLFQEFRSSSLSLIKNIYGEDHPHYTDFYSRVTDTYVSSTDRGLAIIRSIKSEFDNGWLYTLRELLSAEIFSNFLEMSKYLLDEGYKDAAAVMIGSTLEEHLRLLCANHGVDVTITKGDDIVNKKAEILNADLKKSEVYGLLEQKQVTAWLGIRNSAAHGKYAEYNIEQVKLMYMGVMNFISTSK